MKNRTIKIKHKLLFTLILGFIVFVLPYQVFAYTDNFDIYDIDDLDGQQGWSIRTYDNGEGTTSASMYISTKDDYFNHEVAGIKGEGRGWLYNIKKYFLESDDVSIITYFYSFRDTSNQVSGWKIYLYDCAYKSIGMIRSSTGFNDYIYYGSNGTDVLWTTTNINSWTKLEIEYNGNSVRYTHGTTTTAWLTKDDVTAGSVCYVELWTNEYSPATAYKNHATYFNSIIYSGENSIDWPISGELFLNESHVSSVGLNWAEHNTTTEQWSLGIKAKGRQIYDEGWDMLITDLYEYGTETKLKTSIKGVSRADIGINQLGILTNVPDHYFEFDINFNNASGTATTTQYKIVTRFYNSETETYKTQQDWILTLKHDGSYWTEDYWTAVQLEKDKLKEELKDIWGIRGLISGYLDNIKSRFPVSWIYGIYDLWNTKKAEYNETGDEPYVLTFNMGTTSAAGFLKNTDLKILDFESVDDDYGTWITLFRTILSYALWLGCLMMIIFKTKKFIFSLQEED